MRFKFFLLFILMLTICVPASAKYYQYTGKDGNVHYTDEMSQVPESRRSDVTTHESVTNKSDEYNYNQVSPEEQTGDQGYFEEDQQDTQENMEGQNTTEDQPYMEDQGVSNDESVQEDQNVTGYPSDIENQGETENPDLEENQTVPEYQSGTEEPVKKAPSTAMWRIQAREKQKEIDAKKAELKQRYKALEDQKEQLGTPPPKDAPFSEQDAYWEKSKKLTDEVIQYQKDYQDVKKEVDDFNAQVSDRMR